MMGIKQKAKKTRQKAKKTRQKAKKTTLLKKTCKKSKSLDN